MNNIDLPALKNKTQKPINMLREIDQFFYNQPEPISSCLSALRAIVLQFSPDMDEVWRYGMPFYNYQGKRICYIWIDKRTAWPYLGIVNGNMLEHKALIAEKRSRMKILRLDPNEDLPLETIITILKMAVNVA